MCSPDSVFGKDLRKFSLTPSENLKITIKDSNYAKFIEDISEHLIVD